LVINVEKFANVIRKALNFTVMDGRIVTVGIEPSRPETGYGYICAAERRPDEVVPVLSFKEKPDLETARGYVEAGNYFWNAGIFVWNVRTIMAQMRLHAPQIAGVMDRIAASFGSWKEDETVQELFPTCEKVSIDYAVMEKSDCISVIACNIGWSDLGSFSSIREHIPLPEGIMSGAADAGAGDGCAPTVSRATAGLNKVVGRDVRTIGCEGCIIHAESMETVVAVGLKDYIVAVKDGNVLVCPLSEEQMIKEYSKPDPGKK
jgi:mannose-1-phosphate guanylyltransferase